MVEQLAKAFTKTQQHAKSWSCTLNYRRQRRVQKRPGFVRLGWTLESAAWVGPSTVGEHWSAWKRLFRADWTLRRSIPGVRATLTSHRKLASCAKSYGEHSCLMSVFRVIGARRLLSDLLLIAIKLFSTRRLTMQSCAPLVCASPFPEQPESNNSTTTTLHYAGCNRKCGGFAFCLFHAPDFFW